MSSVWEKTLSGGKATFDKGWAAFEKLGGPLNKLSNKIGSEAFWPQAMDKECDKCARILKSFCKDGFYAEKQADASIPQQDGKKPVQDGPKGTPKVLVKIPQKVLEKCVGIAIFTTMRTGLWVSGAGGSGVLMAKDEHGNWSPPSGILVHTLGVGFMAGIDIYDCVIVINNREALEAFSKVRVSLGGEISVTAGPIGSGGILESELLKNRKPVFSYMKSRGLYAGAQIDGTIIIERNDENARFYGERMAVGQILTGHLKQIPPTARLLMEVAKDAEGKTGLDQAMLSQMAGKPTPGDTQIEHSGEASPEQKMQYGNPSTGEGQYQQQYGFVEKPDNSFGVQQGQPGNNYGQSSHNQPYFPPPPGEVQQPQSHLQRHDQQFPPPPTGPPPQQHSSQTQHASEGYYAPPAYPPRPS